MALAPKRADASREQQSPFWQEPVHSALSTLLQLREDWDSYGARAPTQKAAADLLAVLHQILEANSPVPSIVPSPLGHFQAEWHRNGVDLEVEVVTPTKVVVSFADDDGYDWQDSLDYDFTQLTRAVFRLGTGA
jgi:hypothetical protein